MEPFQRGALGIEVMHGIQKVHVRHEAFYCREASRAVKASKLHNRVRHRDWTTVRVMVVDGAEYQLERVFEPFNVFKEFIRQFRCFVEHLQTLPKVSIDRSKHWTGCHGLKAH